MSELVVKIPSQLQILLLLIKNDNFYVVFLEIFYNPSTQFESIAFSVIEKITEMLSYLSIYKQNNVCVQKKIINIVAKKHIFLSLCVSLRCWKYCC